MNEIERAGLAKMRDRWIAGGAAAGLAPAEWEAALAPEPAAGRERLLLAIAGQALDVAFRPAAPKTLKRRLPLPRLGLPTLPEALASLFRAALRQAASDGASRMRVIRLVAARGFVSHPLDWMPSASSDDAPPVYAPWIDWQSGGSGDAAGPALGELTIETWHDFTPTARRLALADIRRIDPTRARALLEGKAAGEPAETRLPLIELLRVNLSADDVPYLQSLAADRSGKVKQLAARLLARIGQTTGGSEKHAEAIELAEFLEKGRAGLLRRRTVYTPRGLKSHAQVQRRAELFDACQLVELAGALETGEEELIANWQLGSQRDADRAFAAMAAASGSDAAVASLGLRLFDAGDLAALLYLLPRLGEGERRRFLKAALSGGTAQRHFLRSIPETGAGTFGRDDLMGSRLYKELRAAVAGQVAKGGHNLDFDDLGFLATASAADAILADLTSLGLGTVDPSLALLRLNAALRDKNEPNWR